MSLVEDAYLLAKWYNDPCSFFRDITGLEPNEKQKELLYMLKDLQIRRILICSARTTGKTMTMAVITLWIVVVLPFFIHMPMRVSILSGSFEQSKTLVDYVKEFTSHRLISEQIMGEPTKKEVKFKNGGWILALPASERTVLSKHCDFLIVDEAAEKHLLDGTLIKKAIPLISASKYPRAILSSTPYEYLSYFVDMWTDELKQFTEYRRISWGTLDCPWISRTEYEEAKRTWGSEEFSIHWEGKPIPILGTMLNLDDLKKCRMDTEEPPSLGEGPITWGIDWGFHAPTVLHICQLEGEDWNVIHTYEWQRKRFQTIHEELDRYREKFPPSVVNVDSSHIGENQRLKEAGYPIKEVKFKSEKPLLQASLRAAVEWHRLHIWSHFITTLTQLSRYTPETKRGDDYVDSLMLAIRQPSKVTVIESVPIGKGRTQRMGLGYRLRDAPISSVVIRSQRRLLRRRI